MVPYTDSSSLLQSAFNLFLGIFFILSIESFFNFTTLNCHIRKESFFVCRAARTTM